MDFMESNKESNKCSTIPCGMSNQFIKFSLYYRICRSTKSDIDIRKHPISTVSLAILRHVNVSSILAYLLIYHNKLVVSPEPSYR